MVGAASDRKPCRHHQSDDVISEERHHIVTGDVTVPVVTSHNGPANGKARCAFCHASK